MTCFVIERADMYDLGHPRRELGGVPWRDLFPNFQPWELCSPDDKSLLVNIPAITALQNIRFDFKRPMHVTSGYRTREHNAAVGGASRSWHMAGVAFDVALKHASHGQILEALARKHGARGIGRYPKGKGLFIHMDWRTGARATWGQW